MKKIITAIVILVAILAGGSISAQEIAKCKIDSFQQLQNGTINSLSCYFGLSASNIITCKNSICALTTKTGKVFNWNYEVIPCNGDCITNIIK